MGHHPVDAACPPPGELSRVLLAIVTPLLSPPPTCRKFCPALSPFSCPSHTLTIMLCLTQRMMIVLSEELMGGNSGNTGSALALGELPRVVQVVVCSPSLSCLHIPLCLSQRESLVLYN